MDLFKFLHGEGQAIIVVNRKTVNTGFSTRSIFLRDGRIENGLT